MKLKFNPLSQSVLLCGSILAANFTPVYATGTQSEIKTALHFPFMGNTESFNHAELSAEKMLEMADNFSTSPQTPDSQKISFALVYSAAHKGLAEAQFRLANYYIEDELLEADDDKATYWLELAMAQDHQGAKFVYESINSQNFDIGC